MMKSEDTFWEWLACVVLLVVLLLWAVVMALAPLALIKLCWTFLVS